MRRPILFVLPSLLLAIGIVWYVIDHSKKEVAAVSAAKVEPPAEFLPVPQAPTQVAASSQPIVPASKPQPVTNDWRKVVDSRDAMATINEIHKNGTVDEKNWAYTLLTSCNQVLRSTATYGVADPASSAEEKDLALKKRQAVDVLSEKCKGVKELSGDDRHALEDEFMVARQSKATVLAQLNAATDGRDGRWSSQQVQLISDSLYSGDALLAKAAYGALMQAFDTSAPGGDERFAALQTEMGGAYFNYPSSQFESLLACRNLGWCNGGYEVPANSDPTPNVVRLMVLYKAAFDSHADVRSILAIR